MNLFDVGITTFLNQFSQHSRLLDTAVSFLAANHLFKGGVLAVIIWWAWFKTDEQKPAHRQHILATLCSCVVAMAVARVLALTLPFRLRPLHQESLHLLLPYGMEPATLDGWSSFPSDHATLFFALAAGLCLVNRKVGILALLYTAVFIALPRVYLGLHYPTDIIAGALIGIIVALAGNKLLAHGKYLQAIESWAQAKPHLFYPLLFLFTYQIADMFNGSRGVIKLAVTLFRLVLA